MAALTLRTADGAVRLRRDYDTAQRAHAAAQVVRSQLAARSRTVLVLATRRDGAGTLLDAAGLTTVEVDEGTSQALATPPPHDHRQRAAGERREGAA